MSASILLARAVGVEIPKGETHRAMADVVESMNTARLIAGLIGDGKLAQSQPSRHPGDSHAEDVLAAIGRT